MFIMTSYCLSSTSTKTPPTTLVGVLHAIHEMPKTPLVEVFFKTLDILLMVGCMIKRSISEINIFTKSLECEYGGTLTNKIGHGVGRIFPVSSFYTSRHFAYSTFEQALSSETLKTIYKTSWYFPLKLC